jgi:hypothetical protein
MYQKYPGPLIGMEPFIKNPSPRPLPSSGERVKERGVWGDGDEKNHEALYQGCEASAIKILGRG